MKIVIFSVILLKSPLTIILIVISYLLFNSTLFWEKEHDTNEEI